MVIQAGDRSQAFASLFHPYILCQAYFTINGSKARSVSIYSLSISSWCWRSTWSLTLIWVPRRRRNFWSPVGYQHMDTLVSTIIHVFSEIQVFPFTSCAFGLVNVVWSSAKSSSSLVGVSEGSRGICVCCPRYCKIHLIVVLQRHQIISY